MAKQVTFEEFLESVRRRTMLPTELWDYIEFDRHSPIPRLRFRSNVLLDQPPATFDLDNEIRQLELTINGERREQRKSSAFRGKKLIVAEGDSWFNLPPYSPYYAIGDRIYENGRFDIENSAYWGHTLEKVLEDKEYMTVIDKERPDFFLLSAGGNDLQIALADKDKKYIYDHDPKRPTDEYLTPAGTQGLIQIQTQYQKLLDMVSHAFPKLPILCHGYDCPPPEKLPGNGQWLGQHLKKNHKIPDSLMVPIVASVLKKLNIVIAQVTASVKMARHLDLQGKSGPQMWKDDMHPGNPGFLKLTTIFEDNMNQ